MQPRGCSRRLQRALTDFGADHAFAAAATKVQEHYGGVSVPAARVRTAALHHVTGAGGTRAPQPVRTLPAHGPAHLVAEAGGTMVVHRRHERGTLRADRRKYRQVRYQEARLVAAQAHGTVTTHFGATLHEVTGTGLRWAQAAHAAGWALGSQIHTLWATVRRGSPNRPGCSFANRAATPPICFTSAIISPPPVGCQLELPIGAN